MKIYLVTVRPPLTMDTRYFDSLWVVEAHAKERAVQLREELKRSGHKTWFGNAVLNDEWYVIVTEAIATDGRLDEAEK